MNSAIFKVIKKQVKIIENNCDNLKNEICNAIKEVNIYLKDEKLKKEEKENLLEKRFDLKKMRNILNNTSCKLL